VGRKHKPAYRVTAIDGRRDRSGEVIEELGSYDPLKHDEAQQIQLDRERIEYWLSVGAQPTETMRRLLHRQGIEVATKKAKEPRTKKTTAATATRR
jgi:small subunit ribosomal protein S16